MAVRRAQLAFILVTVLLDVVGIGLVIPVMPDLIRQLSGGDASEASRTYGVFVAIYAAMQFLCAPLLGALSDRFGRRPVLLVSLFGAALDYVVLALAPTLGWLFAARVVAGITAANFTVATAYIADVSPPEKRAQNFGLVGAMFGIGFIVGPAIGGLLGDANVRLPFAVGAGITLLNALYGTFVLPESLGLEHRRAFDWRKANPASSLARLGAARGIRDLLLIAVISNLAQFSLQAVWVLHNTAKFGWGPRENGWTLATVGILAAVVQGGLIRVLVARLGEVRCIVLALVSGIGAFLLYGFSPAGWVMFVGLVVGAFSGLSGPAVQALVSRQVAANEQGAVQGGIASLGSLCAIVGPLVSTRVFAWFTAPDAPIRFPGAPFLVGVVLLATSLVLALRLKAVPGGRVVSPPPPSMHEAA